MNRDLKKLLVASLGEDVQEKVQFMTQDKAQLGMEVLRLCTELQRVDEEAQLLSVRSDVWEGKFKACRLVWDHFFKICKGIHTLNIILYSLAIISHNINRIHILLQAYSMYDPILDIVTMYILSLWGLFLYIILMAETYISKF